jgi:hypothetical protein
LTPFPPGFVANLYAEYSLKLGRSLLAFNVNVDNLFNAATTLRRFPTATLYQLDVPEEQLLDGSYTLESAGNVPHPMFNMDYAFNPPIAVRVGMRYSF